MLELPPCERECDGVEQSARSSTLSFGVTYWDNLGWKDTFASPQYTARQWDYAHALRHTEVYTPQVVVNGRADIVGTNRAELEALIRREGNATGPSVDISNGSVAVGAGLAKMAQVWLVRFDPNIEQVSIARGENSGLTLPHKNVVKQLVKLGDWNGKPASYHIPKPTQDGLREAVLVQAGPGGSILAAARE